MTINNIVNIENAFINIKNACEQRLEILYPAGIPEFVQNRLSLELKKLEKLGFPWLNSFEIYRLLFAESKKSMQYLSIMDIDASSIIVFLLSESMTNPLPPHYYCPNCGYFEKINTHLFGIDLPEKKCPNCEKQLTKEGFNLYPETVWDIKILKVPNMIAQTTEDFFPFARHVIEKAFPHNHIIPRGSLNRLDKDGKITMTPSGFFVLPTGTTMDDYSHLHGYLEDGTICMCDDNFDSQIFRIELIPNKSIQHLVHLQQKTGLYLHEITQADINALTWTDLRNTGMLSELETDLLYETAPKSFYEMIKNNAATLNSYHSIESTKATTCIAIKKIINSNYFKHYPCFTREDFFEIFLQMNLDYDSSHYLANMIRRGRYPINADTYLDKEFFPFFNKLPTDLQNVCMQYRYVCSRAHAVQNILIYSLLAFYLKADSKTYGKIVFPK